MRLVRSVLVVLSALAAVTAAAQIRPVDDNPIGMAAVDEVTDWTDRRALAEKLVASRESPGRELEPRLRKRLVKALSEESIDALRERLASGNIAPMALGDSQLDLSYSVLAAPCRLIDTRVASGILSSGSSRSFKVAGSTDFAPQGGVPTGCGVPRGATAAMINFIAVNPQGAGNLRGTSYPNALPPTGSLINYQMLSPNLNVANGVVLGICDILASPPCDYDITIEPNGADVHLVADVLGYFTRFPLEEVRNFLVQDDAFTSDTTLAERPACTNFPGLSVTVTAPRAGKVWVRANVKVGIDHTADVHGNGFVHLNTSPTTCTAVGVQTRDRNYTYAGYLPSGLHVVDVPMDAIYNMAEDETLTFYVNGNKGEGYTDVVSLFYGTLTAEFIPD